MTSDSRSDTGLFFRSDSKSTMDCSSTPGAPWLAFTRWYASLTSCTRYLMDGLLAAVRIVGWPIGGIRAEEAE